MLGSELHRRLHAAAGNRSFRHLAELTETNPETVRRYMQGQAPSVSFVSALCGALSINCEWLLTGRGTMRCADVRRAVLRDAEASELFGAMAITIETLIDRVDRLEVLVQMLEIRVRTQHKATNLLNGASEGRIDARATPGITTGARVRAVADVVPERPSPSGR